MTEDDDKQPLIEKPWIRGVVNGVIFTTALMLINYYGWFGEARPLDQDAVVEYVLAGVVFGAVIYILQFWKEQRRLKAKALARRREAEDRDQDTDSKS